MQIQKKARSLKISDIETRGVIANVLVEKTLKSWFPPLFPHVQIVGCLMRGLNYLNFSQVSSFKFISTSQVYKSKQHEKKIKSI